MNRETGQETSKKLHLVFDIDDCLATAIKIRYRE